MSRRVALASLVLLVGLHGVARANERLPAWIEISPGISSATIDAPAGRLPTEDERAAWELDGFGFVDLLWKMDIRIERSGMIESKFTVVRHFLSDAGVAQGGNLDLYADAWRDRLTIEAAYASSAGSPPVFVDPDTIEVMSMDEVDVFSDIQRVVLPIPGLHAGSNATVVGTRRFQSADFPLKWSQLVMLGSDSPIDRIEIHVSREAGAPRFSWRSNDPELECVDRDGMDLRCVRAHIPAVRLDPNVLSYADLVPHLFIGQVESWHELQDEVGALVEAAAKVTPSIRAKVEALKLEPKDSETEKLWKLFRFVADEVRYVSLAHGDSTVVPHPASLTLSRRYGDCKDKVTLLVAMARVAGLDVVPVLTSSERKDLEQVLAPSSSYFDHMIACLDTGLDRPICVDPTQAYSRLELSPLLAGAISLVVGPKSDSPPGNLPAVRFGWEVDLKRELTFDRNATLRTHDIRAFGGPGAAGTRAQIAALSLADRKAWIASDYRDATGMTTAPAFIFRSLTDAAVPYEIESQTSLPGGYRPDQKEHLDFDPWLVHYARAMISTNEHHPYRFLGLRYVADETVSLCCGEIEHFGPTLDFTSRFGSLRRTSMKRDDKLVSKTVLELPARVIPPDEVPEFQSFIMQSLRESGRWFSWRSEP